MNKKLTTAYFLIYSLLQKLKEAEAHAAALQASTESLREEASSSQNRLERTVAALRIAGSNAAKARADADTAEATASSLSQSLQSLESVVTETKRACQTLQQEQTAVSSSATTIQAKLLHKEADLARALKEVTAMRGQLQTLESSAARWQQDRQIWCRRPQHQQRS
jgi:chromosome segregation ATPase